MVKVSNGKDIYYIPTSWEEITYGQYKDMQGVRDEAKILSILCNMPVDLVERLGNDTITRLSILLSFLQEPIKVEGLEPKEELTALDGSKIRLIKDIKEKSFGQKIYLHELVKENEENIVNALTDIVLVYSQEQITGKDFDIGKINDLKNSFDNIFLVDLYSTAMYYIEQLKVVLESERNVLHKEPTREQKLAGIDMFSDFGVMNTVKALAGGDVLKYEAVTKLEYNIVFTHMVMNKVQSDFEENYRAVMKRKR